MAALPRDPAVEVAGDPGGRSLLVVVGLRPFPFCTLVW
jgi:hypothetical protein